LKNIVFRIKVICATADQRFSQKDFLIMRASFLLVGCNEENDFE
jgi:hypothetical protein